MRTVRPAALLPPLLLALAAAARAEGAPADSRPSPGPPEGPERVQALVDLSEAARSNAPAEAVARALEAEALASKIGDAAGRARALNAAGVGYYLLADYERSLEALDRSRVLARDLGLDDVLARALNNTGIVHYVRGETEKALDHYTRALEIWKRTGERRGLARAYNNLGNVYDNARRYDESLRYYAESLSLFEELGDLAMVGGSLNNIAIVLHKLGRNEEALDRLRRALAIAQETGDPSATALTLENLGLVARARGRHDDAIGHYRRSLEIWTGLGNRREQATCLLGIGRTLVDRGDPAGALDYLERAVAIADELRLLDHRRDATESLSVAHARLGEWEKAYDAHRAFKEASDALLDEAASRRLAEIQARHAVEDKDREIQILQGKEEMQRLVRNASIAAAGLLLVLVLLLFNRYRLKERANRALRAAQEERERAARAELTHVARVATLGEMASVLAHELNQPLTGILSNAQAASRLLGSGRGDVADLEEALRDIAGGAVRAREIIRRLRALMRRGAVSMESLRINDVVREIETFIRADAREKGVALEIDLAPGLPAVEGDRIQLQQVLLNLVHNGAEAIARADTDADRRLHVSTGLDPTGAVRVAVRDSGPRVSDGVLERMFEPFFTTKAEGLGMGLAICRTILEAHGGELRADRNDGGGLTVRFTLPVRTEGRDAVGPPAEKPSPRAAGESA